MKATKGFSLIELLVAIAAIAVLAAIVFPVYSKIREKAKQVTCISNLKQLGMGMHMYMDDWDGYLPMARVREGGEGNPSGNWAGVYYVAGLCDPAEGQIYPYVKSASVYLCPSDRGVNASIVDPAYNPYPLSYGMNYLLSHRYGDGIIAPFSRVGLLLHMDRSTINGGSFDSAAGIEISDQPSQIHNGGTCVLYCDLHVKWSAYTTLMQSIKNHDWDPDRL